MTKITILSMFLGCMFFLTYRLRITQNSLTPLSVQKEWDILFPVLVFLSV